MGAACESKRREKVSPCNCRPDMDEAYHQLLWLWTNPVQGFFTFESYVSMLKTAGTLWSLLLLLDIICALQLLREVLFPICDSTPINKYNSWSCFVAEVWPKREKCWSWHQGCTISSGRKIIKIIYRSTEFFILAHWENLK